MPKYENCKRILLSLSLQTSDAHVARRKSAKLTSLSNDIFELGSKKLISKDQINAILRSYALKVEREMVAQDAVDRANRFSKSINFMGLTLEESDIIDAELHRRMAKLKSVNDISTPEIDALKAQGYRELMVLRLKQMLDLADYFPRITHSNDIIKEMITEHAPNEDWNLVNQSLVDTALHRGRAAAHLNRKQSWHVNSEHDLQTAFGANSDMVFPYQLVSDAQPHNVTHSEENKRSRVGRHVSVGNEKPFGVMASLKSMKGKTTILEIADLMCSGNQKDILWDTKTSNQAKVISKLLDGYLQVSENVHFIEDIEQLHLDRFSDILCRINPRHGKASNDRKLTPKAYFERYVHNYNEKKYLSGATKNRHWTYLGQLFQRAKRRGVVLQEFDLKYFRSKKKGRSRNARLIPDTETIRNLFFQPLFTGCSRWNHRKVRGKQDMHVTGTDVFHRGAYFVPMLAHYHGLRRDEACGLAINDIDVSGEHPIIKIRWRSHK